MPSPDIIVTPTPDGHALPVRFSGMPALAPEMSVPPRRTPKVHHPRLVVGILGTILIVGVIGAVQLGANLGYDDAKKRLTTISATAKSATAQFQRAYEQLGATSDVASRLLSGDSGVLADPTAKETLAAAVTAAGETVSAGQKLLATDLPTVETKPALFWDLFAATERLSALTRDVDGYLADLDSTSPAVAQAETTIDESGVAFLGTAAAAASSFEAAHLSARNADVIALRSAASAVSTISEMDDATVDSFNALQDAAAQVVASEQAELSSKSGPLLNARLEVETFARSLAPGVLLEFDWSPIVNNAGSDGSMGGLTTWWWDEPDRAAIQLSDSVAEQWPADRSKALVAHEVGHAISVKCEESYDSSTQDSIEKWATAWAISVGFSDDANGVWAYGYPPQSYIDAANGCR